jgi:hypothetical protein
MRRLLGCIYLCKQKLSCISLLLFVIISYHYQKCPEMQQKYVSNKNKCLKYGLDRRQSE